MKIEQFEDKNLSHYSYAILSECENKIVLVDPSRNIQPYLAYAELHQAKITGVIETHRPCGFCKRAFGAASNNRRCDLLLQIGGSRLSSSNF